MSDVRRRWLPGVVLGWVVSCLIVFSIVAVIVCHEPAVEEYHHAVVRQATVTSNGWHLVVEGEVGAFWTFWSREYREPGTSLYVGLSGGGWKIVPPPR